MKGPSHRKDSTLEKNLKHFHFKEAGHDWDAVVIYDDEARPVEMSWHGIDLDMDRFEETARREILRDGRFRLANVTVKNGVSSAKIVPVKDE